MIEPRVFNSISLNLPENPIFRRLGYNKNHTLSSETNKEHIRSLIGEAVEHLDLCGVYLRIPLEIINSEVHLENGVVWKSPALSRLLDSCAEAVIMGATGGRHFQNEIDRLTAAGEMEKVVVYDAAASELVDGVFDWLMELVQREILREGGRLIKHRFSAGYGDFTIKRQKDFFDMLDMQSLGVELTPDCILIPEKSVTSVSGIMKG